MDPIGFCLLLAHHIEISFYGHLGFSNLIWKRHKQDQRKGRPKPRPRPFYCSLDNLGSNFHSYQRYEDSFMTSEGIKFFFKVVIVISLYLISI